MDTRDMRRLAVTRFGSGVIVLALLFVVSAGTLRYWQGWVYLVVLFLPMALFVRYLIHHDPELLRRRLKLREERERQSRIQRLGSVVWLALLLVPGLDQRFGWSSVPWPVVLIGDALVLAGYLLFVRVMRENSYASRVIEVQEGQQVITTGPYAVVRHPMYLAVLIMLAATPLALGSWVAMVPALGTPFLFVWRVRDEEALLLTDLPGYREYAQRIRYRLIPGLW